MKQSPKSPESLSKTRASLRASISPGVYVLSFAVLFGLFVIFLAAPVVQWWAQPGPVRPDAFDSRMSLDVFLQQGVMNGFTVLWFFAVGASFGSFMNVVTWRMPRGMNFVSQSSICPKCKHAIRGRHNLPVVGWIMLGGRCYDCGEPISFRYPLVEILFGGAAFVLCAREVATGGWNLPFRSPESRSGFYETLWTPQWNLLVVFAFHFCLFVWLLTICLFETDEEATPKRFAITALLIVAVVAFLCPVVQPVSWLLTETMLAKPSPFAPERFSGLVGILLGAVAALPAAMLRRDSRAYAVNLVLAGALVGGHLGWHAAISVIAIANVLALLMSKRGASVALMTAMALIQIVAWRWLHHVQWELGALGIVIWIALAAVSLSLAPARGLVAEASQ